jgi:hypothetical protein
MRRELLFVALALSLAGCAAMQREETRTTERLLAAAGFQRQAADTPEKVAHLQGLTPGKIARREQNGQASYFYADRNVCNCLYAGTEQQYQEYRKLARQQTMADEAADLDRIDTRLGITPSREQPDPTKVG